MNQKLTKTLSLWNLHIIKLIHENNEGIFTNIDIFSHILKWPYENNGKVCLLWMIYFHYFFYIFFISVSTNPEQPSKHVWLQRNIPRESLCWLHLCKCDPPSCCDEFYWVKKKKAKAQRSEARSALQVQGCTRESF